MKIIVCGPPHSGKSVFLGGLCENLPRDQRYLFRACPDGEGTWTYKGQGSEQYRRKGKFSQEAIDWYCQSLSNCDLAPIILVDIGGIPSDENRRILAEGKVTHAIIITGNLEKIPEWEQFLKACEIEIITTIHSDYYGTEDNTNSNPMVVHHLERGNEETKNRPVIQAVAQKILNILPKKEKKMELLKDGILEIAGLADALNIGKNERGQYTWTGADLHKVAEALHNNVAEMPEVVRVDGAAPAWLVAAIVHECHPREVELNSPDGYIRVGCRKPEGTGSGIAFNVSDREDGWVGIEAVLDPSKPLAPSALIEIAPPLLPMSSKVVLSGRIPNWLAASLVISYHGATKAVACFQPGVGSTVCMTHSADVELGTLIS
ncbi:MAG: CRISPR-associated protein Csx3 [Candidatus Moraniibacteriota bacterium]